MKASFLPLLLTGLTGLASAASIADAPQCAISCALSALPQSPCTISNQTCLCVDPTFNRLVGDCVKNACTIKEALVMRYGLGRDIWTLQPYEITMFLKLLFVLQLFYISGLAVIKASVIYLYIRVFNIQGFRTLLWCTQIFNFLLGGGYILLSLVQCQPFQHYWNGWDGEQDGHCADLNTIGLTHVAFNIALDVWMLILPATQLYKLNMELKKKIGVMAMFSVGVFLTSVSIVRIKSLLVFATSFNITAECLWGIIWSYVELCVGIFVACMPAARQLAWRFFPKLVNYTRESLTGSSKSKREVQNEELTPIAKGRQSSKSGTLSSNITQSHAGSVMDPNTPRSATFGYPQSHDVIMVHERKE
ncbi:integral membrane protein [Colletotrichum abscissum]|uniref:Integral membrane protein n=1 Tax=Colletotrichum abscissum TaxID=1671311 RepID=A0A9P9X9C1_9PEZI|nr:integral membrane protein [Colletotrichum abscissum]